MSDSITVPCPECRTRLRPPKGFGRRRIRCPNCSAIVLLRNVDLLDGDMRPPHKLVPPPDEETYALQADSEPRAWTAKHPRSFVPGQRAPRLTEEMRASGRRPKGASAEATDDRASFDRRLDASLLRKERPDSPPKWTFFSGVFEFPWRREVCSRWLFLSGGCSAVLFLAAVCVQIATRESGYTGVVLAFFVLPEVWLTLWTFSYAAACAVSILEDTAGGCDRIRNWPEPNWREWMWQLLHVGYVLFYSTVAAYALGVATDRAYGVFWPTLAATVFLLFPFLWLSALDAGSTLFPFSSDVARSLISVTWGWLTFYVLAAVLIVACGGVGWGVLQLGWLAAGASGGPVLAAAILIYARLLGRLAWLITRPR
ncbi:MAG: hypothetical protein GXP27_19720 [Planctomycetes bacterium]|nr:hypothetical protein [Planctomycetota bacterium]